MQRLKAGKYDSSHVVQDMMNWPKGNCQAGVQTSLNQVYIQYSMRGVSAESLGAVGLRSDMHRSPCGRRMMNHTPLDHRIHTRIYISDVVHRAAGSCQRQHGGEKRLAPHCYLECIGARILARVCASNSLGQSRCQVVAKECVLQQDGALASQDVLRGYIGPLASAPLNLTFQQ